MSGTGNHVSYRTCIFNAHIKESPMLGCDSGSMQHLTMWELCGSLGTTTFSMFVSIYGILHTPLQ